MGSLGLDLGSSACMWEVEWGGWLELDGVLFAPCIGEVVGRSFGKSTMSFEVVTSLRFDPMSLLSVQACEHICACLGCLGRAKGSSK